ncbi:uncharacterized protein LOC126824332 [Patella vulgata]|uniref:uncharacterized protein LOC126824332 n=1 Tax=Patella vulgata TaxID=6465 RepID=UPI00217FB560|nr:uncharacterized protein LOC126824332 [Patella vulgata]
MKEKIYGWYPSIKDVYNDRIGVPSSYHLECLYKFQGTMYQTKPIRPGPDNLVIQGHSATSPVRSRPSTAVKSPITLNRQTPQRPKTAPIPQYRPIKKLRIPTPQECWSTGLDETAYNQSYVETYKPPPVRIPSAESSQDIPCYNPTPVYTTPPPDVPRHTSPRAQSASIHRHRQTKSKRPVKSAGPIRSLMTPNATPLTTPTPVHNVSGPIPTPPETPVVIPSPSPVQKLKLDQPEINLFDDNGKVIPDYDQEKKKYGWAVEVHGNPYKYKNIPRRLPYSMKVSEPEVAPQPPKIHMETNETFFQNTIPRRPLAYSINKDWVSEIIHAKRMQLQQREGIKYRWKNFAFVY